MIKAVLAVLGFLGYVVSWLEQREIVQNTRTEDERDELKSIVEAVEQDKLVDVLLDDPVVYRRLREYYHRNSG